MAHLGLTCFDVVGLSMGAYIALMMCLDAPEKIGSCVCASVGSGAHLPTREAFIKDALASADNILKQNKVPATQMALAPNRIQLRAKDPDAWQTFCDHLGEHPAIGAAHTLAQVQAKRPGLHDFADQLAELETPVLILAGDEDEPCLDASLWLKRQMPYSGLKLYPRSGHLLNLESPDEFNKDIACFHRLVAENKWPKRDHTPFLSMFQSDN